MHDESMMHVQYSRVCKVLWAGCVVLACVGVSASVCAQHFSLVDNKAVAVSSLYSVWPSIHQRALNPHSSVWTGSARATALFYTFFLLLHLLWCLRNCFDHNFMGTGNRFYSIFFHCKKVKVYTNDSGQGRPPQRPRAFFFVRLNNNKQVQHF